MRTAIILGTRPEIIKFSPVIRELARRRVPFFIIDTNQHYSKNMSAIFFEELELPAPQYNLRVGSGDHGEQTGEMLRLIEDVLQKERPDVVLVQGDTNTALAGALAAAKLGIAVGHVEGGLRSYDRTMPEELNRIVADHLSDYLFLPTASVLRVAAKEGFPKHKLVLTGNTVVDAIGQNKKIALRKSNILKQLGLRKKSYFLLTLHRPANVDDRKKFRQILNGLAAVVKEYGAPMIFPIHPRTKKMLEKAKLQLPTGIVPIAPSSYFDFLILEDNARLIFTDSGTVQEEACVLGVPCITIRDNTERPETVAVKANYLAGTKGNNILSAAKIMERRVRKWKNPFGDGRAARRMVDHILRRHR